MNNEQTKDLMMSEELSDLIDMNKQSELTFISVAVNFVYTMQNLELQIPIASLLSMSIEKDIKTIDLRVTFEVAITALSKFSIDKTCVLFIKNLSQIDHFPFKESDQNVIKSLRMFDLDNKTGICTLGIDIS